MDFFKCCVPSIPDDSPQWKEGHSIVVESPVVQAYSDDPAAQILQTLRTADESNKDLEERLKSVISVASITDAIAERILRGIEDIIQRSAQVADAMNKAIKRATDMAREFSHEHPYYTTLIAAGTIIALGVLVCLAPWVVEALGFASRGPRAGSFAARWMSSIGNVHKGSIYSYLQRLGMVWHG